MSKSWGLAGIIWILLGSPELIARLHTSRPMYEIGNLQAYIFNHILKEEKLIKSIINKVLSNKYKIEKSIKTYEDLKLWKFYSV